MGITGIALGALLTTATAFIGIVIWTFVNYLKQKETIEDLQRQIILVNEQLYREIDREKNSCDSRFEEVYRTIQERVTTLERVVADDRKEILSIIDSKETTKTKSKKQLNG